jgi:competence protein ComGC
MKMSCSNQGNRALTLVEVVVTIFALAVLVAMLLPAFARAKTKGGPNYCVNNLKQIGLAYRIWAGDNDGKYPFERSVTNGGTLELNSGRNAWLNYLVMSNELSTPKFWFVPKI